MASPRRILIIKPSAIGDVVHTLPVLDLLRTHHPDAHIAWLVTPRCSGLLLNHPQLDEVLLFDRQRLAHWYTSPRLAPEFFAFLKQLRRQRYDLVLDLQGLFRSAFLARVTGAAERIGFAYAREGAPLFYTHKVPPPPPPHGLEVHALERYLDLAQSLGLPRTPVRFVFNTTDADRAHVSTLLAPLNQRPFAVLLPGTNWPTKRYPTAHFATVAGHLHARGLATVVSGGASDQSLADTIRPTLSLCGQTTLPQTTALLERATIVIANDTGPMHIAAALGKPLLTPFGPTNPVRTGPYPLTSPRNRVLSLHLLCSPCYSKHCTHQSCLTWLDPHQILREADHLLASL